MRAAREAASARALGVEVAAIPVAAAMARVWTVSSKVRVTSHAESCIPPYGALDDLLAIRGVKSDRNILNQGADGECGVGTECFGMGAGASGGSGVSR